MFSLFWFVKKKMQEACKDEAKKTDQGAKENQKCPYYVTIDNAESLNVTIIIIIIIIIIEKKKMCKMIAEMKPKKKETPRR